MSDEEVKISLTKLAEIIGGTVVGDGEFTVTGVCSVDYPSRGNITFATSSVDAVRLDNENAGVAVIVKEKIGGLSSPLIVHDRPRLGFTLALRLFNPPKKSSGQVHPTAVISDKALLDTSADIGPNSVIEPGAVIGSGVIIGAGCYVGHDSIIGARTRLYPNVTVMHDVSVGTDCIFHPGVVIGGDGFGYETTEKGNLKMPQVGRVEIGNRVEVGANTTIDRATLDVTKIGDDVKLDNLIQIAHNVQIGSGTRIAAQAGISGRAKIGKNVVIAGQAGFNNGITVGDGSVVGGQAGVIGDVKPGQQVSGYPAREHEKSKKVIAATMKLPKLLERVEQIENELKELNKRDNPG